MNLHEDRNAFIALMNSIHEKTGYRMDVLEKDYYVVLILYELSDMQKDGLPAYFKGGTALYKALHTTRRFSEDIDLSVDSRGCSRSQNDRRLERATKKYKSLVRNPEEGKTNRSEVISIYEYSPAVSHDVNDALQRFGKLKIEATSFTISEPVEELTVTPMIYDLADDGYRQILENRYGVKPFSVQTISMERIFIDKIFAAESYVRKSEDSHRAFEAAKHIYDLSVLQDEERINELIIDQDKLHYLLEIRLQEEKERLDGVPGVAPKDFILFSQTGGNSHVRQAYEIMQRQYVFREEDRIPYEIAIDILEKLGRILKKCPAWMESADKNSAVEAFEKVEKAFEGAAKEAGFNNEGEMQEYMKAMRKEGR